MLDMNLDINLNQNRLFSLGCSENPSNNQWFWWWERRRFRGRNRETSKLGVGAVLESVVSLLQLSPCFIFNSPYNIMMMLCCVATCDFASNIEVGEEEETRHFTKLKATFP